MTYEYRTTVAPCFSGSEDTVPDPVSPGPDWELVCMAQGAGYLFWSWRRPTIAAQLAKFAGL